MAEPLPLAAEVTSLVTEPPPLAAEVTSLVAEPPPLPAEVTSLTAEVPPALAAVEDLPLKRPLGPGRHHRCAAAQVPPLQLIGACAGLLPPVCGWISTQVTETMTAGPLHIPLMWYPP